jgi:hypothetical protein
MRLHRRYLWPWMELTLGSAWHTEAVSWPPVFADVGSIVALVQGLEISLEIAMINGIRQVQVTKYERQS